MNTAAVYQDLKVYGMYALPEGWSIDYVGNFADIGTGNCDTQDRIEGGAYPFYVRSQTVERIDSYSYDGTAVLTAGDGVGTGKVFHFVTGKFAFHQRVYKISDFQKHISPRFFYEFFRHNFIRQVARYTAKSSVDSVRMEMISKMAIPIPPLPEQKRIAAILSTWDQAIELTEKLIAAKQKRKAALMQRLLAGKVRLPRFAKGHWRACQLGDVANNSTRRNGTTTTTQAYSVTNSVGMVPMSEDVIGESIDRYKTVGKYDFAYNPMRINVGSIAMWDGDVDVLVSPDYVVFQCGDELDAEFLNHFRKTHFWHQFVNRSGGGSVRVRIYFSDLAEMPLKLPPLDEQKAIAAVLNTQDREIGLLQKKLDALRRQKKGLMQQLLTGKVRVSVGE